MPELAEVALFARDLTNTVKNKKVRRITFHNTNDWGQEIIPFEVRKVLKSIMGKKVYFESKGKALYLYKGISSKPLIEFRLGMTGQFHLRKKNDHWKRHYFLSITFDDCSFYFADPRRFARITLPKTSTYAIGGYDSALGFWKSKKLILPKLSLSKDRISWLLDNGFETGVGNYMANEALGALNLSPFEPFKDVAEATLALKQCLKIAEKSFKNKGNSFGSGYFLLNGDEGEYSKFCKFYGNLGIPKVVFKGRPVFSKFCTNLKIK